MAKTASAPKAPSKTELLNNISEATKVGKKEVKAVLDALTEEIRKALGKKGPGAFQIPGLAKIVVQKKKAQPARQGIHPITKEPTTFKAKPARNVVRIRPLKSLKDMVA